MVGGGWAIAFSMAGCDVRVFDENPESRSKLADLTAGLGSHGVLDDVDDISSRIAFVDTLPEALIGASFVQESILEDLQSKRELYAALDSYIGENTIVASSTSALSAELLFADLDYACRCIVAHPTNPPYAIPLVELCKGGMTSDSTLVNCIEFFDAIDMIPVVVKKDVPGFVLNRLQAALMSEAIALVEEGVMSPAEIDKVVRFGLAGRWLLTGAFGTAHLNAKEGFEDYMGKFGASYENLISTLSKDTKITDSARKSIAASLGESLPLDRLDDLAAQRDRMLTQNIYSREYRSSAAKPAGGC